MLFKSHIHTTLCIGALTMTVGCDTGDSGRNVGADTVVPHSSAVADRGRLAVSTLAQDDPVVTAKQNDDDLTLTVVEIESEAARELLGTNIIKVRDRRTAFVPKGAVYIPHLETVTDDLCNERLKEVSETIVTKEDGELQFVEGEDIFVALNENVSTWISRASGVFKYTRTKEIMTVPTKLKDFKEAVQTALDYVGKKQLVTLSDNEELDILFVSAVQNAMSTVEEISQEKNPKEWQRQIETIDPKSEIFKVYEPEALTFDKIHLKETFISDFYVGFGRRLNEIPVVGSQIVLRLDGNGNTAMVEKQWRTVDDQQSRVVEITGKSLQELIIAHPEFYERYSEKEATPEDITVLSQTCGYMDAPINYQQGELRPGCEVTFALFGAQMESYPIIIVPLDDGDYGSIWGETPKR